MTEVPLEPSCHDEAIAVLERRIDALHASAHSIVDRHWTFVYSMEQKLTGWEPVSYTHLDVYKRQIHVRVLLARRRSRPVSR